MSGKVSTVRVPFFAENKKYFQCMGQNIMAMTLQFIKQSTVLLNARTLNLYKILNLIWFDF